jgi:hypothetical protein
MPFVRGRVVPETENTGRAKHSLDALLWIRQLNRSDAAALDEIQILREYLESIHPPACAINLYVPEQPEATRAELNRMGVSTLTRQVLQPSARVLKVLGEDAPAELINAASTAVGHDSDVLVVDNPLWFPFITECDKLGVLIANGSILERQCEIFVRGHEVPLGVSIDGLERALDGILPPGGVANFQRRFGVS